MRIAIRAITLRQILLLFLLTLLYLSTPYASRVYAQDRSRMFRNGDRWVQNGTISQLKGFDIIRVSSYLPLNEISAVPAAGKQVMIAVTGDHYWVTNHPDSVLAQHERDEGPLELFENFVSALADSNIQVSHWLYNIEVPGNAVNYFGYDSTTIAGKRLAAGKYASASWQKCFPV